MKSINSQSSSAKMLKNSSIFTAELNEKKEYRRRQAVKKKEKQRKKALLAKQKLESEKQAIIEKMAYSQGGK